MSTEIRRTQERTLTGEFSILSSVHSTDSTSFDISRGDLYVYENGRNIIKNEEFSIDSKIEFSEIDLSTLKNITSDDGIDIGEINLLEYDETEFRKWNKKPFISENKKEAKKRSLELFNAQSLSVAIRLEKAKAEKIIIGVSGGLDSTLALLVSYNALSILRKDPKNIIGISMPGFGTSDKTYNSSLDLMKKLKITTREINISEAVKLHFKDIDHDENDFSKCYENSQARERTQILMDIANKENGIVLGTGDMSEMALGWCTFNGDHMAMYGCNSNIVKTLIPKILEDINGHLEVFKNVDLKEILESIIETPISPELLPTDEEGNISQKTEENIGPYEIHDFFLYHTLRYSISPKSLYALTCHVFKDDYSDDSIKKWLKIFYTRFITQRFKTNTSPEYAVLGNINLDFKLPSDVSPNIWIDEIENI